MRTIWLRPGYDHWIADGPAQSAGAAAADAHLLCPKLRPSSTAADAMVNLGTLLEGQADEAEEWHHKGGSESSDA